MCRKEKLPSNVHFQIISYWQMSRELLWGMVKMDQRTASPSRLHHCHRGERVKSRWGVVCCHLGKNRHGGNMSDEFAPIQMRRTPSE